MTKEMASSSGLADFTLVGAVAGYAAFQSIPGIVVGDSVPYAARNGAEWEMGTATYNGASALARTTVLRSSNGNAKVNFSAAPTVFCTLPSSQIATNTSPGAFAAHLSANLTVLNWTKVPLQTKDYDVSGAFDTVNGRFQPAVAGYYLIAGQTQMPAAASCSSAIYRNGIAVANGGWGTSIYGSPVTAVVYLNGTTDYVELYAYSATSQTITSFASVLNYMQGVLIAPSSANGSLPPVMFAAKPNAVQNLPNGVSTKILFQSEDLDTDNIYDASNSRFQPNRAGWYWVATNILMAAAAAYIDIEIYKNGAIVKYGTSNNNAQAAHAGALVFMNGTSDYLEVFVYTTTPQNTHASFAQGTFFSGFLLQASVGAGNAAAGPVFKMYLSANVTTGLVTGAFTKLPMDVAAFDSATSFDATNKRFQPKVAGYYQVNWLVHSQAAANADNTSALFKNGVQEQNGNYNLPTSTGHTRSGGSAIVYLNGTTDYAEVYYYMGSGTTAIIGSTGFDTSFSAHLITASSANAGAAGPVFSASLNATTSVPMAVSKLVPLAKDYDSHNAYSTATGRFQPTVAGYYKVGGSISWNSSYTGNLKIFKNGVNYRNGQYVNGVLCSIVDADVFLNGTTDYVELNASNNTGSAVNASGAAGDSAFFGHFIRAS